MYVVPFDNVVALNITQPQTIYNLKVRRGEVAVDWWHNKAQEISTGHRSLSHYKTIICCCYCIPSRDEHHRLEAVIFKANIQHFY